MTSEDLLTELKYVHQRSIHLHVGMCHFGLLVASNAGFGHSTWCRISQFVRWPIGGDVIVFRSDGDWIEIEPVAAHATACLCWSGHRRVAYDLCDWAQDAALVLKQNQVRLAEVSSLNGHHGTFHTLCLHALQQVSLASLVNEHILFGAEGLSEGGLLRSANRLNSDPPIVRYFTVTKDAIGFVLEAIRGIFRDGESICRREDDEVHLRVEPPHGRKYSICWRRSNGMVFVNDQPVREFLTPQHIRWLDALLHAHGEFRSLTETLGVLEAESINQTRFRRQVPQQLQILIETKRGRGARLRVEWLK